MGRQITEILEKPIKTRKAKEKLDEKTHKTLGKIVSASYFTGAGLSLFTPPPLVSREREGLNNIKLHKIFANIHVPAMIITNVYADKQHDADKYREIHKVSAYTAFASYSFAMISIILDF